MDNNFEKGLNRSSGYAIYKFKREYILVKQLPKKSLAAYIKEVRKYVKYWKDCLLRIS